MALIDNSSGSSATSSGTQVQSGVTQPVGGSGIWSSLIAAANTTKSIIANNLSARRAYKRQRALIDAQNEYNKPINQRKRLQEAGYNPYLAFDSVNAGTSESTSAPSVAQANYGNLSDDPYMYASLQKMGAETGLIKAQEENTSANTENTLLQNVYDGVRNDIYEEFGFDQASLEILAKRAGISLTEAQTRLASAQEQSEMFEAKLKEYDLTEMRPAMKAQVAAQTAVEWAKKNNYDMHNEFDKKLILSQITMNLAQSALNEAKAKQTTFETEKIMPHQVELVQSQEELAYNQAQYYDEQIDYLDVMQDYYAALTDLTDYDAALKVAEVTNMGVEDVLETFKIFYNAGPYYYKSGNRKVFRQGPSTKRGYMKKVKAGMAK